MSPLDSPDLLVEPLPENLVEVGAYATRLAAESHGLVVLALGAPYWLQSSGDGERLLVESWIAARVRFHLAAYDRESAGWPPPPITDPWKVREFDLVLPLLWSALMLALFRLPAQWVDAGILDSAAVFDRGEWWRPATALFLHADAAHVISNALGGILLFTAVSSTFGRLRGWACLAVAAVLGNLAVAAAHTAEPYRSLGASTAIFAGLGMLTGRAIRVVAGTRHPHRWRAMFVPLAAGVTVLALHGAGGMRVDVGAHLAGFIAGVGLGFVAGTTERASARH
ncbi:MAG TPA: rhomboid family intramembrane serine protease [Opitutaceae bacterium]|nr:rhomboid family intramembrane serine protease [Opitutaceae bacterium]